MQEFLVFAVILTAIAVLLGFGYGLYALRLWRDHPDRSALRVAALNLLEPGLTIGTILLLTVATNAFSSSESVLLLVLLAGIPLTIMLLAPLFNAQAVQPLRTILVMYGVLRWVNTVALWVTIKVALQNNPSVDNATLTLAGILIYSGIVILFVSVAHISSSLETVKTQSAE